MPANIFHAIILLALAIVVIVIIASTKIHALWLRLCLIGLLITTVLYRIDAIGLYFWHVDLINETSTILISYAVIFIVLIAFIAAYIRRPYLLRAEEQRKADEEQRKFDELHRRNAALIDNHEKRMAEIVGTDYSFETYDQVAKLNKQIVEALNE